jgi:hypothetical protein
MMFDGKQVDVVALQGIQQQIIAADVRAQPGIFPEALPEGFQTRDPTKGDGDQRGRRE